MSPHFEAREIDTRKLIKEFPPHSQNGDDAASAHEEALIWVQRNGKGEWFKPKYVVIEVPDKQGNLCTDYKTAYSYFDQDI